MENVKKESYSRTTQNGESSKKNLTISSGPVTVTTDIDKPIITWLDNKLNGKKK